MEKEKFNRIKYIDNYNKNNYEEVKIRVKKGKKEIIKLYAEKKGESVNSYINRLIDNDINNLSE